MTNLPKIDFLIQFKTDTLREEWNELLTPPMQALTLYVARLFWVLTRKPLIVTSVDAPDPKSAHHYGCAIDFRTHHGYYPKEALDEVRAHVNKWFPNPGKTTLLYHGEGDNFHGHLQTPTYLLTYPIMERSDNGPDYTN